MYYLDPLRGKRRRALVRDQFVRIQHRTGNRGRAATLNLFQRTRGLAVRSGSRIRSSVIKPDTSDPVIIAHARAILGHSVSHPRSVEILANNGQLIVSGELNRAEASRLFRRLRKIPGVMDIESRVISEGRPFQIRRFQAARRRRQRLSRQNFGPRRIQLGSLAMGLMLSAYGFKRAGRIGRLIGAFGLSLIGRSVQDPGLRNMLQRASAGVSKPVSRITFGGRKAA